MFYLKSNFELHFIHPVDDSMKHQIQIQEIRSYRTEILHIKSFQQRSNDRIRESS
jgi:hypothetical protein